MTDVSTYQAYLWAYSIDAQCNAQAIDNQQLSASTLAGEYTWLHIQSDAMDATELLEEAGLEESVIDGLIAAETRPRATAVGEGTLIYLRGINKNPDADPDDMVSLRVWLTKNMIVTARRKDRRLMSVQDVRSQLNEGQGPASPADMLIALVTNIANRIHETVDHMDDDLVAFETALELTKHDRQALAKLRRQAASIRRYLAPQRDALEGLFRFSGLLDQEQLHDLREQTDRMARYVEDLDLARERAIVLQDELRNRIADQQGVRMYVLSMVTAIFLPLSFLTGVFGMNVGGLPGTESQDAFTTLMGAMGVLAVIMLIAMLWRRWL